MRRIMGLILLLPLILQAVPRISAQTYPASLEQAVIDGCLYGTAVELTDYAVTADTFDSIFTRLLEQGALPWYTTSGYSYRYNERTGYLVEFTPGSLDPALYDRTLYEQKLAAVMSACIHDGMAPEQIALSVHDYLALNNIYDETLEANTGYDLLVSGTTVCAGYTALYMDILNRAGVPCVSVTSEPMEHTWNLVQIDGCWYHVDVTWDDPTEDIFGRVEHTYFLLTDAEISAGEEPHHDWVTDISCTDTRFSDAYWRDIRSGIFYESSEVSYLLRSEDFTNTVCRRDEVTGKETALCIIDEAYTDLGRGSYIYSHMGLSYHGGRLWFGTLDALRSMNTDGGDVRTELTYGVRENGKYIYSFALSGNTARITTSDHEGNMTTDTQDLQSTVHIHSFTEIDHPATCEDQGYTLSECICGLTCQSDLIRPLGHDYKETERKNATFSREGYVTEVCRTCAHTQTRQLAAIALGDWLRDNIRTIGLVVLVVISVLVRIARLRKSVQNGT